MSADFRARQIRVNQIINSGSTASSPLLIYGLGSATDQSGGFFASHFTTGSDTWLFISGTAGSKNSSSRGVVTFKGDVVISGTIYNSAGASYSVGGGGGGTSNWNELSPSPRLNSTASVSIAGALGSSYAAQNAGSDVFFFVSGTSGITDATARKSVFGGDVVISGSHYVIGNVTGTNAQFSGDVAVDGGDITTTASTFNLATSATTLNLGSSTSRVVVPGDLEVQGTTVTVDASNITVEDPLIGLGFTTGSVAGSAGDRGFIGGITGAGNNVAFAWSNNSGSFVATKTTSTPGATAIAVSSLQPIRASSLQVNGTTAFITSSDGSTLVASGTAVQLKAASGNTVKFFEAESEYISFSRSGGSSALIRSTEAAFPSLYLSGSSVHIDSYSGLTWFDSNSNGGLAVDSSNLFSPKILGRLQSGTPVNLTISGSTLTLGSNDGQILLYRGASEFLRATYDGASDSVISAQSLNLSVGGTASTQLSGSTVSINHGAGVINFQRHGTNFATISSGSGDLTSLAAAAGKTFQIGGTGLTKLTGSLLSITAGSQGIGFEKDNSQFLSVVSGSGQNATISAYTGKSLSINSDSAVTISGSSVQVTGSLIAQNITGSLRKTTGGLDFITGSGVTVNYNSSGQWELTASGGGGGSPGGSDTYVQFNDGGTTFGGDSGLTYNKTTDTLTGVTIKATGGLSGSLRSLTDGTPYLVASSSSAMAQTGSISITSGSANGQVTVNSYVFPSDLSVSLTGGRTFGRYATGTTIPATGKTPAEVILLAIAEPINPTVNLTPTNPITSTFGISGSITTSITGSYTINTLGATVSTAALQFRSGSTGAWTTLTSATTNPLYYDHTFTVGSFFTTILNYQYIITDSAGATLTTAVNLTPQAYAAPTMALTVTTTTGGGFSNETNTLRERGNVGSTITGTITRNRSNAPISSYSVQYQVNGTGGWTDVPGLSAVPVSGNPSSISIPSTSHNDSSLNTSTSLLYRVQVVDAYQTSTSGSTTITFQYGIFYGPSASAPVNSANVRALGTKTLVSAGGTTQLDTGNTQVNFTMALPTTVAASDTISSVTDLDALNADITSSYVLSTFNVNDGGGTAVSYKVYTMTIASPYASSHRHSIVRA